MINNNIINNHLHKESIDSKRLSTSKEMMSPNSDHLKEQTLMNSKFKRKYNEIVGNVISERKRLFNQSPLK